MLMKNKLLIAIKNITILCLNLNLVLLANNLTSKLNNYLIILSQRHTIFKDTRPFVSSGAANHRHVR